MKTFDHGKDFHDLQVGDIIYNIRMDKYAKIIGREQCGHNPMCEDCQVHRNDFRVQYDDGTETNWCFGVWGGTGSPGWYEPEFIRDV